MLNNVKMGPKIIGSFVLVAVITAVVGFVGLTNLNEVGKVRLPSVSALLQMARHQNAVMYGVRGVMLRRYWEDLSIVESQYNHIEEKLKDIEKAWALYEPLPQTREGAAEWKVFVEVYGSWKKELQLFLEPIREKMRLVKSGASLTDARITKLDDQIFATAGGMRKIYESCRQSLNKLIDINENVAAHTVQTSTTTMSAAIAVGFLLAVMLGVLISRSISVPLSRGVEMIQRMGVGDLSMRLHMQRRDEIGVLAQTMDRFAEDLQTIVIGAMKRIADGDVNMEIQSKDARDEITPALKKIIDTLRKFASDVKTLVNAAVEGRITTRADARAYQGVYGQIMEGINATLSALTGYIDIMPAPAMIIDKDFTVQYMNKVAASLGGMDQQSVVGRKCYDFFKTTDCKTDRCACYRAMQTGQQASSDTVAKPAAGTFEIDYSGVPIKDASGKVVGVFEVITDQTAVRKAQRLMQKIGEYQTKEIENISAVLRSVAERNLSVRAQISEGDSDTKEVRERFLVMAQSLNTAIENLDNALQQVAATAVQVGSAATQISAGSQAVAQGASEQAGAIEEVSSNLQEITSMTRQNAANTKEAKTLADGAKNSCDNGMTSMNRLSGAIEQIKKSSDQTAKIIKTIDEIAFQTNLLALNAAVEAARAGDAGKGFAVVAEEVRNLAMRSAEAAKNTANMIEEAVKNADNGVALNQEVLKNLGEINAQAQKVSEVMAEIAAASEQQSTGIEQINKAIDQMNKVVQQNAANSEESASAAEELSAQSEEMQGLVTTFTLSKAVQVATEKKHHFTGKNPQKNVARSAATGPDPRVVIPLEEGDKAVLQSF